MNKLRRVGRNVFVLGWVSLLTDLASEMLYPILPIFLVGTLGVSPAILGLIDGIAEGGSSILRWLVGAYSDRLQRRKPFVVAGYSISAISKPLMGLAAHVIGWPIFFAGRGLDRLGKSVRTSARDALIADSTPADVRGLAFGIHRAMDTIGAVLGPLFVLLILLVRPDFPLQWLFFIALVPGACSALLAAVAVRDVPHVTDPTSKPRAILQRYPRRLWHLITAAGIFSLGGSSDAFLLLRCNEIGFTLPQVILVYVLFNVVYSISATPLGGLSDRYGRKTVVAAGWTIYAIVYLGFALTESTIAPWILLGIYGLYQAMTEGVTKAFVTDVVPAHQRAGAIGLFYTITGLSMFVASFIAGAVWDQRWLGGTLLAPFALGAICAALAVPVVLSVPNIKRQAVDGTGARENHGLQREQ